MAVTVTPPGTAAQPLNSPDHATWAGQVYADLRSLDTAVAGAGAWGTVATWSALPPTGNWPGRQLKVSGGLGLCVALWDGTAWRIDPASSTGVRTVSPAAGVVTAGSVQVQRVGGLVTWRCMSTVLTAGAGATALTNDLGSGWQAAGSFVAHGTMQRQNSAAESQHMWVLLGQLWWMAWNDLYTGAASTTRPALGLQGLLTHMTDDPWPTTAPA